MNWEDILSDWIDQGKEVNLKYDKESDVLYASLGKPVPSWSTEEDGYILRYSFENDKLSGMTVIGTGKQRGRIACLVHKLLKKLHLKYKS